MKKLLLLILFLPNVLLAQNKVVGIHLLNYTSDNELEKLSLNIQALSKKGINTIFLEVDYSFDFKSHPELIQGDQYITKTGAKKFAEICRQNGIEIIPQFQSFGHQSWAENTWSLLTKYPELDLTPGAFPDNKGIYCREWDPTNPKVNEIVFPLIEEIVSAFNSKGIHIGMDEIFLITDSNAVNTRDINPAIVFSKVVNEFHEHFVKNRGLKLYMWGDRLIDGSVHQYGDWESSNNGTHPAIDMIPKDIVICDWHYNPMSEYTSVPMFIEKGFDVLPCSYTNEIAAKNLIKYSYRIESDKMLGHMFTTWGAVKKDSLLSFPSMNLGIQLIGSKRFFDVNIRRVGFENSGLKVELKCNRDDVLIYYTIDGTVPTQESLIYKGVVSLGATATIKALAFDSRGSQVGEVTEKRFLIHKAVGAKIKLTNTPNEKWPAEEKSQTIINGELGGDSWANGQWLAYDGTDFIAVIDLGKETEVSVVELNSANFPMNWIHHLENLEVYSGNGKEFQLIAKYKQKPSSKKVVNSIVSFDRINTRYLKVVVPYRLIPEGYSGSGQKSWLFIDELIVR